MLTFVESGSNLYGNSLFHSSESVKLFQNKNVPLAFSFKWLALILQVLLMVLLDPQKSG